MTATALFRRFLSENGLKTEFEREWAMNHQSKRIKWSNDFLSHYIMDILNRTDYYHFLNPTKVIDWGSTKRGWEFWDEVNNEWFLYYDRNKHKVSPYIRNSYAGN